MKSQITTEGMTITNNMKKTKENLSSRSKSINISIIPFTSHNVCYTIILDIFIIG